MTTIDLNLPELLTIDDLFPAIDFGFPLTQQPTIEADERVMDLDEDWSSSLAPQKSTQSFLTPQEGIVGGEDLGLDFGDDLLEDTTISLQMGRREQTALADDLLEGPAIFDDDGLGLDFGDDTAMPEAPQDVTATVEGEAVIPAFDGDETAQLRAVIEARQRDTESPLSEAGSEFMREMDQTMAEQQEIAAVARQRSRRLKPLVADVETVLHNSEIKAHAADRSRILRPASFLPRDPVLLTLLNMQKSGEFVTNAMNDGRSRDWAPELQGLLSFEVVHRSGQAKRKRDSGIADLSEDEHSNKSPRLEFDEADERQLVLEDEGVVIGQESPLPLIQADPTMDESLMPQDDDEGLYVGEGTFDETTMPLVHPADSGPVSLGTRRAVHLLRDTFGTPESDASPASSQSRKSILLQDLIPENSTSREDATKMFFEVLVLATKDAIKVEQNSGQIGLPLRIRAKRGLWGSWAEATPTENVSTQEVAITA